MAPLDLRVGRQATTAGKKYSQGLWDLCCCPGWRRGKLGERAQQPDFRPFRASVMGPLEMAHSSSPLDLRIAWLGPAARPEYIPPIGRQYLPTKPRRRGGGVCESGGRRLFPALFKRARGE